MDKTYVEYLVINYEDSGHSTYVISLGQISRRGALPVLAELARHHPEPIGAMEFARASGVEAGTAGRVRDELQKLGLIDAKVARQQGAIVQYEIRLTPLGAELARHVLVIEEILRASGEASDRRAP